MKTSAHTCVCVCVSERERENEPVCARLQESLIVIERSMCVCVGVCKSEIACIRHGSVWLEYVSVFPEPTTHECRLITKANKVAWSSFWSDELIDGLQLHKNYLQNKNQKSIKSPPVRNVTLLKYRLF